MDENSAELEAVIHAYRNDQRLCDLNAILVITEEGCLSCNKVFAEFVEGHLKDPNCLFWVSAMGTGVDIGPFKATPNRVVWDYDDMLRSSGLIHGSGAILIKAGRIDTVITIHAQDLQEDLERVATAWSVPSSGPAEVTLDRSQ